MNKFKTVGIIIVSGIIVFTIVYITGAKEDQEKYISSFYSKYWYLESQIHKNIKEENIVEFDSLEDCKNYLKNKND